MFYHDAFASNIAFELKDYDIPLLYHVVTKESKVSTKDIAQIVVDGHYANDPIYEVSSDLLGAWRRNKEFVAHDNYALFMSIIKQRASLISDSIYFDIVDTEPGLKEAKKMVYNFDRKGFDIQLPFGDNKVQNTPSNFKCTNYSGKLICLAAINQKESEFIPMNENLARSVTLLRDSDHLLVRQVFRRSKTYKVIPPATGHPLDIVIIQVLLNSIELYQSDKNGKPIQLLATIIK